MFWEYAASGVTPDRTPAGVRARTDEILTIDLPEDFTPLAALSGEIPLMRWVGDARMGLAAYVAPGGGQFMAMRIRLPKPSSMEADRTQIELDFRQQFKQSAGGVRVDATATETRPLLTADGRTVDWRFSEGTGYDADGAELGAFRQVEGAFRDGRDSYVLRLVLPEAEYDEAEVVSMLESIELVDPQTEPVPPGNEPVEPALGAEDADPTADDAAEPAP